MVALYSVAGNLCVNLAPIPFSISLPSEFIVSWGSCSASLPAVRPVSSIDGGTACHKAESVTSRVSLDARLGASTKSIAGGQLAITKSPAHAAAVAPATRNAVPAEKIRLGRRNVGVVIGIRLSTSIG